MNIKGFFLILFFSIILWGCGSLITIRRLSPVGRLSPLNTSNNNNANENINNSNTQTSKIGESASNKKNDNTKTANIILKEAESYLGTPYLLGGTNRNGIDCSSLVVSSFLKGGIKLPRTSQSQSTYGKRISRKEIRKGDLIFFATGSNKNVVTHVGIAYEITKDDILFIHASTSKGVRIDNLSNSYWNPKFLFSNRLIK